jgi:hypothetical protein
LEEFRLTFCSLKPDKGIFISNLMIYLIVNCMVPMMLMAWSACPGEP